MVFLDTLIFLIGISCIKTSIWLERGGRSHAPGSVCAEQKTVIRRNQPFRNRRMTRRTFQTITQRWKITDISGAGTEKLRLHQLRNSPTAIKNAIKVIRRCSCVSKRFPIARRLASRRASFADKRRLALANGSRNFLRDIE